MTCKMLTTVTALAAVLAVSEASAHEVYPSQERQTERHRTPGSLRELHLGIRSDLNAFRREVHGLFNLRRILRGDPQPHYHPHNPQPVYRQPYAAPQPGYYVQPPAYAAPQYDPYYEQPAPYYQPY